jgi:MscS family membrane protein
MDELQLAAQMEIGGIELWRYFAVAAAVFVGLIGGKIAKYALLRAEKSATQREAKVLASVFMALAGAMTVLGLLFGMQAGLLFLDLPLAVAGAMDTVVSVLTVLAIGWLCFELVEAPTTLYRNWADQQDSKLTQALTPILHTSLRVTVVLLTLVQIAQVVSDQPVSSILAGLGIGGLAFALAAQDSLKHFFGSIVIFTDRPFEVGDRLVIDGHDGPVEEVGFRSTKIRTLDGHLVTVPNGELVNKNILNISKRPHIRRLVNISLTYDTPADKLEEAVAIVEDILKDHEGMDPDFPPRVYFNDMKADNLNLFVIYWYHPPAYWDFMAFGQKFNLAVIRRFREAGIDFAFPTQTLYLAGDEDRPLKVGIEDVRSGGDSA